MKTKFWLSFLTIISLAFSAQIANAQTYQPSNRIPISDNTLGTQISTSGTNFNITGGLNRGQTLFHSFTDFSVPTNGQANFTNPVGNRDIITRVTGTGFSDINGSVNTNGANFFLLNPNGIVFGTNAQLNVGKAFVGSTANSIDLVTAGGTKMTFGTNRNGDAALLNVAPNVLFNISGLTMGGGNGQISNFGKLQTNNQSQYIGLIGGNVNLDGGKIIAPGGRIDLGGLSTAGTVSVNSDGLVFNGTNLTRSDVSIANNSSVSVRANQTLNPVDPIFFANAISPGSSINISANRIDIADSGKRFRGDANNPVNQALGGLDAGLEVNSGVKTGTIGNIRLDATGDIQIQRSAIFNLVRSGSEGTGGGIKIVGNNIIVTDTSEISTNLSKDAIGRGGDIDIIATGNFSLFEPNYREVVAPSNFAESVITASTNGRGNSGKVKIAAGGSVVVSDNDVIASTVEATGAGDSGGIKIDASSFLLSNGSQILTYAADSPTGQGGSTGNIDITTKGDLTIRGSNSINADSTDSTRLSKIESTNYRKGDAGKITLTAPGKLAVVNRGAIVSSIRGNNGDGTSGGIQLNVGELLVSNLSGISSSIGGRGETAKGTAGDINITATGNITIDETLASLIVTEFEGSKSTPSAIATSLNGTGKGGKITIATPGKVSVGNHDEISSTVEPGGEGNAGGITIRAGELEVFNEGQIRTVASEGDIDNFGNAGNIDIKTTGNITIAGNKNPNLVERKGDSFYSKIATSSFRNGNAGKITIDAGGNISLINKGGIVSQCLKACRSQTIGSAGSITINSNQLNFDRGDISLNANDTAGDITITTRDSIVMRHNSNIGTNSQGDGNGGNININTQFLITASKENNDITASAIKGRGGNVNINALGIFGFDSPPVRTDKSDIIVSSQFGQSGAINLDTLDKDPARDTTELPTVTTDASNQIDRVCSASNRQNKLTVAGRGGLPPNATDPLTPDVVWQDARADSSPPVIGSVNNNNSVKLASPAVGWVFDGRGKVTLIAASTPGQPTETTIVCPNVK
jgi:filamentous hemagglutinin family protein